jgi:hypothetical protein
MVRGSALADSASGMMRPSDIDTLAERIEKLQRERQELRLARSGAADLERNRLELVRAHRDLALALIDRHLHTPTAA